MGDLIDAGSTSGSLRDPRIRGITFVDNRYKPLTRDVRPPTDVEHAGQSRLRKRKEGISDSLNAI